MSFLSQTVARLVGQTSKHCIPKRIPIGTLSVFTQSQCSVQPLTRSLVALSAPSRMNSHKHPKPHSTLCSCGCGIHGMHTKGDKELVEFLQDEINAEKKALSHTSIPSHVDDFTIKQDKADLILTKAFHDEQITVTLNVNHTVDTSAKLDNSGEAEELSSRPDFDVEIKVGPKVLSLTCQFTPPTDVTEGDQAEDVFGISEITMYEGEWEEKMYCASGDILDGMMYDLLMNLLEERGVSNDFASRLSDICTQYEQGLYVNMLEKLQNFVKRK